MQKNIRVIRVIRVQKNIECDPCAKNIFVLSALFVFKKIHGDIRVQKSRVPHVSAPPRTKIREIGEIRVQIIFVLSALLPPFGQWAYGESRVQKNIQRAMP